jgi:hypothetical protein
MPAGWRRDGSAKPEYLEAVARWIKELGALVSANPARHHDGLGPDVFETVGLHRGDGPLDRAFDVGGSAQAVAKSIRQVRQTAPGDVGGGGGRQQTIRIRLQLRDPGGYRVALRPDGDGSHDNQEREKKSASGHRG